MSDTTVFHLRQAAGPPANPAIPIGTWVRESLHGRTGIVYSYQRLDNWFVYGVAFDHFHRDSVQEKNIEIVKLPEPA